MKSILTLALAISAALVATSAHSSPCCDHATAAAASSSHAGLSFPNATPVQAPAENGQLELGKAFSGRLTSNDAPDMAGGDVMRTYRVQLNKDDLVMIEARADVDTALSVYADDSSRVAADDDGGEDNNPRLMFRVPKSGWYRVRLMTVTGDRDSDFVLSLGRVRVD